MSGTLKALFDIRDGNNGENFSGLAKVLNSTERFRLPILPSTSIVGVSMPEEGILTINGREYAYGGILPLEQDADGNITSYTFNMKRALTAEEQARVDGRMASVGTSIDAMGIPYYMSQMNQFLRSFATEFNNILKKGVRSGRQFHQRICIFHRYRHRDRRRVFSFDGKDANGKYSKRIWLRHVLQADSSKYLREQHDCQGSDQAGDNCGHQRKRAASTRYDLVEELATLKSGKVLYRGGTADGFLKCMIADISVDTQHVRNFQQELPECGERD